jgi:hypothetical protein
MDNSPTFIGGVKRVPEPRVVQYTHDDLGFLKAIHVEPAALDPHEKSTTTFERNADGLVTMITSEAPGEAPRHVSIDYDDAEGIFPVKVWNDLAIRAGLRFTRPTGCSLSRVTRTAWRRGRSTTRSVGFAAWRGTARRAWMSSPA